MRTSPFAGRIAGLAAALCLGTALVSPQQARAQVFIGVSVNLAPPPLPVYEQPPVPGPDYIWAPGYWAWDEDIDDYYWVPGTWVQAPTPGYLWTPGYWGWGGGGYAWHEGYWGRHIGFYGGVSYGFGYTGNGYEGGYWNGPHFYYNRSVNNITNVNITNVYVKQVTINHVSQVSYNGGNGGVTAQPTPEQAAAAHETHIRATPAQTQQAHVARATPALFASKNHGMPAVAATARPGALTGPGVVHAARGPATPYVATVGHTKGEPGSAAAKAGIGRPEAAHATPRADTTAAEHGGTERGATDHGAPHADTLSTDRGDHAAATPDTAARHETAPAHDTLDRPASVSDAAPKPEARKSATARGETEDKVRGDAGEPRPAVARHETSGHPAEASHPRSEPHPEAARAHPAETKTHPAPEHAPEHKEDDHRG